MKPSTSWMVGALAALSACAHVPFISNKQPPTYFIAETFCDGASIKDVAVAEKLRERYSDATLVLLTPTGDLNLLQESIAHAYHGQVEILSGFYDGRKIDRDKLVRKVQDTVAEKGLVFLLSHGEPKKNTPNMQVCPWDGYEAMRHASPEEMDRRFEADGAYVTEADLSGRTVFPLNCSAHPSYLRFVELPKIEEDIVTQGPEYVFKWKKLKDRYITEPRDNLLLNK